MASTSKEDNARVAAQTKSNQSAHDTGQYTVSNGQISDMSGTKESLKQVANEASRAAELAKSNLWAGGAAAGANSKLRQDAETARNAIQKAISQRK